MWLNDLAICSRRVIFAAITLIHTIEALATQPAQALNKPDLTLLVPRPLSSAPSTLQITTSSQSNATFNSSSNAYDHFQRMDCSAAMYGVPKISSCLDVYKGMTDSDKLSEFGDRTRGVFEYPLPYRLTSSEYFVREVLKCGS